MKAKSEFFIFLLDIKQTGKVSCTCECACIVLWNSFDATKWNL